MRIAPQAKILRSRYDFLWKNYLKTYQPASGWSRICFRDFWNPIQKIPDAKFQVRENPGCSEKYRMQKYRMQKKSLKKYRMHIRYIRYFYRMQCYPAREFEGKSRIWSKYFGSVTKNITRKCFWQKFLFFYFSNMLHSQPLQVSLRNSPYPRKGHGLCLKTLWFCRSVQFFRRGLHLWKFFTR